jgi:hypothetical protein
LTRVQYDPLRCAGRARKSEIIVAAAGLQISRGRPFVRSAIVTRQRIYGAAAIEVEESDSAAGQVLFLGGDVFMDDEDDEDEDEEVDDVLSSVHLVDLATGACARQPDLLHSRADHVAARLPDGRIICAGGNDVVGTALSSAEVWGASEQGSADSAWSWRELPAMSDARWGCCGCVMGDGRFAVLGCIGSHGIGSFSFCEALGMGDAACWKPLPSMHDSRYGFACAAVAGCVIVAGGVGRTSAEVYDESRNRWLRLPCNLPYENELHSMGSALL